jgi:VNT family MFS transporter (synaptic vesicle glycoprotein 2)
MAALVLGLGNAADAVELLCVSFIIPELDEDVRDTDKSILSAAVFAGMLVGGVAAGVVSDAMGRRRALAVCLIINAVFGALSSASPSWGWLAAARVAAGVGVGGSVPGVFTLMAELLPVARRGFFLSCVAWAWMVGTIYTAGAAWVMFGVFHLSWRLFAIVCSVPAAAAAAAVLLLLPESPRYLYRRGEMASAAAVIELVARANGKTTRLQAGYSLADMEKPSSALLDAGSERGSTTLVSPHAMHEGTLSPASSSPRAATFAQPRRRWRNCSDSAGVLWSRVRKSGNVRSLLRPPHRRVFWTLCACWFTLSFGWYGLSLWIPSLFKEAQLELDVYQVRSMRPRVGSWCL